MTKKQYMGSLVGLLLLFGGIVVFLVTVKQEEQTMLAQEKERATVTVSDQETRVLFFYKDTCANCQQVYPTVYNEAKDKNNIVFINLNQANNRHYIQTYDLKKVPTFVTPKERYTGTDTKKIQRLIAENNKERSE